MHGYALVDVLDEGLGPAVDLKPPTVYAILKRFEDRGLIRGEVAQEGSAPTRRVFTVTEEGRSALPGLALAAAEASAASPLPLAVLLAHLDHLPPEDRAGVVDALLETRRARLTALESWSAHPGSLGVAFDLLLRQAHLEIEVLEAVSRETHGQD